MVTKRNFNFGKRKLQKVRYSFLIPLPVDWVNSMEIGKGNLLGIEMQEDSSLKITPVPQAW